MDGRVKKAEDFLKTRLLDTLTEQINKVTKVRKLLLKSHNILSLYNNGRLCADLFCRDGIRLIELHKDHILVVTFWYFSILNTFYQFTFTRRPEEGYEEIIHFIRNIL